MTKSKTLRKVLGILLITVFLFALAGCYEVKQKFILNPNGSGKVFFESTFVVGDDKKESIRRILEESKGVDVWRDISYELMEDGRLRIKGTAYFKDFNNLDLFRSEKASKSPHQMSFSNENGKIILEFKFLAAKKDAMVEEKEKKDLSEEEILIEIQKQKEGCKQVKGMLGIMLASMKEESTFILPGTIQKTTNFQINEDNSVTIGYDGIGLTKMLDEMCTSDSITRQIVLSDHGMIEEKDITSLIMNQLLFGEKASSTVILSGEMNALFDYDAELADAKKYYAKFEKKFDKNFEKQFGSPAIGIPDVEQFLWTAKTELDTKGSPIISGNSLIVTTDWMSKSILLCLDKNTGKELWQIELENIFKPQMEAGVVYFVGGEKYYDHIYAIDSKTGKERWKIKKSEMDLTSLSIDDGIIYVHAYDSLFAINPISAKNIWAVKIDNYIVKSSLLAIGGSVYLTDRKNITLGFDGKTGQKRWSFETPENIMGKPVVYGNTLYIEDAAHYIYALDALTGKQKWKYLVVEPEQGQFRVVTVLIAAEGGVYRTCTDSSVIALDVDLGTLKWKYKAETTIQVSPTVPNGTVYFVDLTGHYLHAVNSKNGKLLWKSKPEGEESGYWSNVFVYDKNLYLRGEDKVFYCVSMKTGEGKWKIPHHGLYGYPKFDGSYLFYATGKSIYAVDVKAKH